MIAPSWLHGHPEFENVRPGGEWLVGFTDRLERSELHETDWDHLAELTLWQRGSDNETTSESRAVAGPSSQTI